jgi:hypothetical protein
LLTNEDKQVVIKLGRDGKFSAKSSFWESSSASSLSRLNRGRWCIVKSPAHGDETSVGGIGRPIAGGTWDRLVTVLN